MKKHAKKVFVSCIINECELALEFARKIKPLLEQNDVKKFFDNLNHLILHTAMLSKYFYPASKKKEKKERGTKLRSLVGEELTKKLKNRVIRNHLEHFDERIDFWAKLNMPYIRNIIIEEPAIGKALSGDIEKEKNCFSFFSPSTTEYSILGDSININELIKTTQLIYEKSCLLKTKMEKPNFRKQQTCCSANPEKHT